MSLNTIIDPQAPVEENSLSTDPIETTNATNSANTDTVNNSETNANTDPVNNSETNANTDAVNNSETNVNTDPVNNSATDANTDADPVNNSETNANTDAVNNSETNANTDAVNNSETNSANTDPVNNSETNANTDPVNNSETNTNTDAVNNLETPLVNEPEKDPAMPDFMYESMLQHHITYTGVLPNKSELKNDINVSMEQIYFQAEKLDPMLNTISHKYKDEEKHDVKHYIKITKKMESTGEKYKLASKIETRKPNF